MGWRERVRFIERGDRDNVWPGVTRVSGEDKGQRLQGAEFSIVGFLDVNLDFLTRLLYPQELVTGGFTPG